MIIMIFDSILSLLIYSSFTLIHSTVVFCPLLSENFSLFINLTLKIVSEFVQLILKFLLKFVDNIMDVVHGFNSILSILGNFCISVIEFLLHLSFVLYTGVLENFESGTHVFHLRLKRSQVFIFFWVFFYHF